MFEKRYHSKDLGNFNFLVTGGAGFIGSNLIEYLLKYQARRVRVLDNFTTGHLGNLLPFMDNPAFELIEGDIRDLETCKRAIEGIHFVSHQAALGSVPRSVADPLTSNEVNVSGFLNMLCAVKESTQINRFVYASSSSVYGDNPDTMKVEDTTGKLLSPYAATKYINELYARLFGDTYGIKTIGLRYFNVFGQRQSPEGAYAAVIPLFIKASKNGLPAVIYGDGEQSRDFTFVENVVQANIKAFFTENEQAVNQVYNIACGKKTSVNNLLMKIATLLNTDTAITYKESRWGDIRDSLADISLAQQMIGYEPFIDIDEGLKITITQG